MPTEEQVIEVLKQIVDPHTNLNVYDMGLISEIEVSGTSVSLTFRPTSPWCPLGVQLATNIKRRLLQLESTKQAEVKVIGHMSERIINDALNAM